MFVIWTFSSVQHIVEHIVPPLLSAAGNCWSISWSHAPTFDQEDHVLYIGCGPTPSKSHHQYSYMFRGVLYTIVSQLLGQGHTKILCTKTGVVRDLDPCQIDATNSGKGKAKKGIYEYYT